MTLDRLGRERWHPVESSIIKFGLVLWLHPDANIKARAAFKESGLDPPALDHPVLVVSSLDDNSKTLLVCLIRGRKQLWRGDMEVDSTAVNNGKLRLDTTTEILQFVNDGAMRKRCYVETARAYKVHLDMLSTLKGPPRVLTLRSMVLFMERAAPALEFYQHRPQGPLHPRTKRRYDELAHNSACMVGEGQVVWYGSSIEDENYMVEAHSTALKSVHQSHPQGMYLVQDARTSNTFRSIVYAWPIFALGSGELHNIEGMDWYWRHFFVPLGFDGNSTCLAKKPLTFLNPEILRVQRERCVVRLSSLCVLDASLVIPASDRGRLFRLDGQSLERLRPLLEKAGDAVRPPRCGCKAAYLLSMSKPSVEENQSSSVKTIEAPAEDEPPPPAPVRMLEQLEMWLLKVARFLVRCAFCVGHCLRALQGFWVGRDGE